MGDIAQMHKSVLTHKGEGKTMEQQYNSLLGDQPKSPKSPARGRPRKNVTIADNQQTPEAKPQTIVEKAVNFLSGEEKNKNLKRLEEKDGQPVKESQDKYEKERKKYVKKVNRYLKDDNLYKIIQTGGIKRELLPCDAPLNAAKSLYEEIIDTLNGANVKADVDANFDLMNMGVEFLMDCFGKPMPGFANKMKNPEIRKDFEQEIAEFAVEFGDFLDGVYKWRFVKKYFKIIFMMQQMNMSGMMGSMMGYQTAPDNQ